MPQERRKTASAGRVPADLPPDLEYLTPIEAAAFLPALPLEDARVESGDLTGAEIPSLSLTGSVLERMVFAQARVQSTLLRDVRFVKCDLSNAVFHRFEARRVEFIDCRLLGMKAIACNWQDVLVENCDARYAQFNGGVVRSCEFKGARLDEADVRGVNLAGTLFRDASLRRADLSGAKLNNANLRGADIDGLVVHAEDLRGALVTPPQAMDLARLLGLVIG
jgi:uncharacterized protein YjbI with pentapeptide repeats